jgi:hypothetical protein
MKRFTIAFHSMSTGMGLEFDSADTPADALKKARAADKQGLRRVTVLDNTSNETLEPAAFAAKHKL